MPGDQNTWTDFSWQGIRLRVPEDWNLGKVEGDYKSGYARLDDAEIVRVEVEWRGGKGQGSRARSRSVSATDLVDRYVEGLQKKADKSSTPFSVERRANFLTDPHWLEGSDYETFTWEADFRAYNLARYCSDCGRMVLVRILGRLDEDLRPLVQKIMPTLEDHPSDDRLHWNIYGLSFSIPTAYSLTEHELKSGHITLSFQDNQKICRVHRLSLGRMLLKETTLRFWYPLFFKKQLKDLNVELFEARTRDHEGLRAVGKPRSRLLQLLRPLPFISPRPRQYLDSRIWYCPSSDKICIVDYLYRKKVDADDFPHHVCDGYVCHQEAAETHPRGDVELAAGSK